MILLRDGVEIKLLLNLLVRVSTQFLIIELFYVLLLKQNIHTQRKKDDFTSFKTNGKCLWISRDIKILETDFKPTYFHH